MAMKNFTSDDLRELLAVRSGPCVSIYLDTAGVDPAQNEIRRKNALRQAQRALDVQPEWKGHADALLDGLRGAFDAAEPGGTLATFASPGFLKQWRFASPIGSCVVVSATFHTKPLVKHLQDRSLYFVLALTTENVTLYRGDEHELDVVQVPGMPRGMHELVKNGARHSVSKRTTAPTAGAGSGAVYFGPAGTSYADEQKEELKGFFRMVDRAVTHVTQERRAPLILATLDQHAGAFHEVSRNPALLEERIEADPEALGVAELRRRALEILRPRRARALGQLAGEYGLAAARGRGGSQPSEVSRAAVAGRVRTLLIEDGRRLAGRLDRKTGEIVGPSSATETCGDDLLDDLAELVLAGGGEVHVLPATTMPAGGGLAAIYRY
jgi:hypothetical protein